MSPARTRRPRNPEATRAALLEAACALLAKAGPDGVSLSEVAKLAGANRGTAYQHFETREKLVEAATQHVSAQMFRAVFGDPESIGERKVEEVDIVDVTERVASFAMDNPELCRSWFLQVLSMPNPAQDPFWREYAGSIARFSQTELAEPGIDVEVWSIICLAGNFLWPVWAKAHSHGEDERKALAKRFAREMLRVSMFGSLNDKKFPHIAATLADESSDKPRLRLAL
jgi:AcrR family transcriptional regulator